MLSFFRLLLIKLVVLYDYPIIFVHHHLFFLINLELSLRKLYDYFFFLHGKLQFFMNCSLLLLNFTYFIFHPLLNSFWADWVHLCWMSTTCPLIFLIWELIVLYLFGFGFLDWYWLGGQTSKVHFIQLPIAYTSEGNPFLTNHAPFSISLLPQILLITDSMHKFNLCPLYFVDKEAIADSHHITVIVSMINAATDPL